MAAREGANSVNRYIVPALVVLAFLGLGACADEADKLDRAADTTTTVATTEEAATTGAIVGDSERVERLWMTADLAADGSAQITEVIDYDFGVAASGKHGILRYVCDVSPGAPITVESPDAPDAVQVTPYSREGCSGAQIRIGDPNTTVSGRHRYRIDYPLPGVARGTVLDWEAVGVGWEVGIDEAEIHVLAPFELLDATCSVGVSGSQGGCDVREVAPGHLVTTVKGIDSGEGVSIEARTGSDLASAPAAPEPAATTSSPGSTAPG
jgi:hypothetical protein